MAIDGNYNGSRCAPASMCTISAAFGLKSFLAMASQALDPDSQPSSSYDEPATQLDPEVQDGLETQLDPEPEPPAHEVDPVKKKGRLSNLNQTE